MKLKYSFFVLLFGFAINLQAQQNLFRGNNNYIAPIPTPVPSVTSSTGKVWMDRNLGASQIATSPTDAASYGDLYQWGRGADGHQLRNSNTTSNLSSTDQPGNGDFILAPIGPYNWLSTQNTNLWQGVNGVNNPCPTGYRLPTETELTTEINSWETKNAAGAFKSPLKLPLAGFRGGDNGLPNSVNTLGRYWSSTINSIFSRNIGISSGSAGMGEDRRATGYPIRCIKD